MKKSAELVLAVDLGGTKLRSAVVSKYGKIAAVSNLKTEAEKGPEYIIDRLVESLGTLIAENQFSNKDISGICIAVAGPVDVKRGIVTSSPHLPGWHNVPLKKIIAERTGIRTFVDNDVNAAAIGEYVFGAAKGVTDFVYIAVGTGLGGGIIINGQLYKGADGAAGEIGHTIIKENGPKCSCGNCGCLEALCAGTAIEREIRKKLKKISATEVARVYGKAANEITAKDVGKAANEGDLIACEVISNAAYYLGIGLANVINVFNPQMIVLGGGVIKIGDIYVSPAIEVARETAFELPASTVKIVRSKLGDDTGILGAAALIS
jgi:glucokinase